MSKQERNEAIARTIEQTAGAVVATFETLARLRAEQKLIPWWRFLRRRRMRRRIAFEGAKAAIIGSMGAAQLQIIISQPIPKNKPGTDDQLPRVYPVFVPPLGDLPGEKPLHRPDGSRPPAGPDIPGTGE